MDLSRLKPGSPRKAIMGDLSSCGPSVCPLSAHASRGFCRQIGPGVAQTHLPASQPSNPSPERAGVGWASDSCFPAAWQSRPTRVGESRNSGGGPRRTGLAQSHPQSQQWSWDRRPGLRDKQNTFHFTLELKLLLQPHWHHCTECLCGPRVSTLLI